MATTTSAINTLQQVAQARERIVRELAQLSDSDCRYPAEWNGTTRTVTS